MKILNFEFHDLVELMRKYSASHEEALNSNGDESAVDATPFDALDLPELADQEENSNSNSWDPNQALQSSEEYDSTESPQYGTHYDHSSPSNTNNALVHKATVLGAFLGWCQDRGQPYNGPFQIPIKEANIIATTIRSQARETSAGRPLGENPRKRTEYDRLHDSLKKAGLKRTKNSTVYTYQWQWPAVKASIARETFETWRIHKIRIVFQK